MFYFGLLCGFGSFFFFFLFLFSFLSLPLKKVSHWKVLIDGHFLTWMNLLIETTRKWSSQHLFFIMPSHLKWELRHKIV